MTKTIYSIFIIVLLKSCNDRSNVVSKTNSVDSLISTYSELQPLFQEIKLDTLYVFSDWSIDNEKYAFKGQAIDSAKISLLPYQIKNNWNKDIGACFQFPIDSKNIALIARVPGEYVSSSLKLFIFNLEKDSIIKTIHLADNWGDAGESSVFNSCIFNDKGKRILILTYCWSSFDHSVGNGTNENDSLIENWKNYYLYLLTINGVDTLSKDSAEIVKVYPSIVNKLANY